MTLDASYNVLTSVNYAGDTRLESINLASNKIAGALNLANLNYLKSAYVSSNEITSIDLSNDPVLTTVSAGSNKIETINLANSANVSSVSISSNKIKDLDLSAKKYLKELDASYNDIENINLSGCSSLATLTLSNNKLSALSTEGLSEITTLKAANNNLSAIDLKTMPRLATLTVTNNKLAALDLSANPKISSVSANSNCLTAVTFPETVKNKSISFSSSDNRVYIPVEDGKVNIGKVFTDIKNFSFSSSSLKLDDNGVVDLSSSSYNSLGYKYNVFKDEESGRVITTSGTIYVKPAATVASVTSSNADIEITVTLPENETAVSCYAVITMDDGGSYSVSSKNNELTMKYSFTKEDIGRTGSVVAYASYKDGDHYRSSMGSEPVRFTVQ